MYSQSTMSTQQRGQQQQSFRGQKQQQSGACAFGLDVDDTALVLIDHQTGLFNLVRDMDVADLRNNVLALAKAGRLSGMPVILTASDEDGPHGRLLPEFEDEIPNALFVPRTGGEINAWEFQDFVKTIESVGKKNLIMAGTLANVCLAFPAISAACCGYKVYAVIDASGSSTKIARELLLHRLTKAGVTVVDTISIISELLKTHKRQDIQEWWTVMSGVVPRYKLLIDAFSKGEPLQQTGQQQGIQSQTGKAQKSQQSQDQDQYRYKDRFGKQQQQQEDYPQQQQQQWR